jgi:hypothetical protein
MGARIMKTTTHEELKAWATLALILILSGLADAATL